jgi:hypothetical protein
LKYWPVALGLSLILLASAVARAQVTVDAAKVTCKQFAFGTVGKHGVLAYWLSGYLNAKRDNTLVDIDAMEKNVKKLQFYCLKHHDELVMDATKSVFGLDK